MACLCCRCRKNISLERTGEPIRKGREIQQTPRCASPSLEFQEGPTGDFNDIWISCACGARQKLNQVLGGLKIHCRGERSWLGPEGREEPWTQDELLKIP